MFLLFKWAKSIIAPTNYQTEIEKFIVSKNPKSVADIDHWAREYTYSTIKGGTV